VPTNRADSAEGQNRSCSNKWAAKQEKLQPLELCFFLTPPFIELFRTIPVLSAGLLTCVTDTGQLRDLEIPTRLISDLLD
jgi:hypothetical protein